MRSSTILIIDNEPSNIRLIAGILEKSDLNFKILTSTSSDLGIEIAIQTRPDIIITNWQIPGAGGIDAISALKSNELTKEIPVIVTTGNVEQGFLPESETFDFICKPINRIELIARINSALRITAYYNKKVEDEKSKATIRFEKYLFEIESKNNVIIAKTLTLARIDKINKQFHKKLKSINRDECLIACEVFSFVQDHANNILKHGNDRILNELEYNFEQINEEFFKKITTKYSTLTHNERKLCAYQRLNLSTNDISSITSQSVRSIEIARTRLREKLGLKGTEEDLHTFLLRFRSLNCS